MSILQEKDDAEVAKLEGYVADWEIKIVDNIKARGGLKAL
jgi:hypothetical protein